MTLDPLALRRPHAQYRALAVFGMIALLATICGTQEVAAAPCTNMITASDATPSGYGSAFNRLTDAKELLIHGTECDGETAQVSIGSGASNQYVYKLGYYWTGSAWQEVPLSGSTLVSDTWYKGEATGAVPLGITPNYLLGYVCQRKDHEWKCGCSDDDCTSGNWQMQALAGFDGSIGSGNDRGDGDVTADACLAPPQLVNPIVIEGDTCPGVVDGRGRDVLIKMPNKTCTNQLNVRNTNNVHVIGGEIKLEADVGRAISFAYVKGHAHVEGIHIDVQNRPADGIRIFNSPQATLTVQNALIEGLGGRVEGPHGDVIHTQGGGPLAEFRVENLSGLTSYQGIFTPYRLPRHGSTGAEKVVMKDVNIGYDPRMPSTQKPLMLLTLGRGDPSPNQYGMLDYSAPEGTSLSNVYIDTSLRDAAYYTKVSARPNPGSDGCGAFDAVHKIDGKVCNGLPKSGPFAPRDAVGLNYDRTKFCTN